MKGVLSPHVGPRRPGPKAHYGRAVKATAGPGAAGASDSDRARPVGPPGRRATQHRGARQPQQRRSALRCCGCLLDDAREPRCPTAGPPSHEPQPSVGRRHSTTRPTRAEPVTASDGAASRNQAGAERGAKGRARGGAEGGTGAQDYEATPRGERADGAWRPQQAPQPPPGSVPAPPAAATRRPLRLGQRTGQRVTPRTTPAVGERLHLVLVLSPGVGYRPACRRRPGPREEGLVAVDVHRRAASHLARHGHWATGARVYALGLGRAVTVKGPSHRGPGRRYVAPARTRGRASARRGSPGQQGSALTVPSSCQVP